MRGCSSWWASARWGGWGAGSRRLVAVGIGEDQCAPDRSGSRAAFWARLTRILEAPLTDASPLVDSIDCSHERDQGGREQNQRARNSDKGGERCDPEASDDAQDD